MIPSTFKPLRLAAVSILLLGVPLSLSAAEWTLTAYAGQVVHDDTIVARDGQISKTLIAQGEEAFGFGLSRQLTPHIGLGVDIIHRSVDLDLEIAVPTLPTQSATGAAERLSLEFTMPILLRQGEKLDLFVAPLVAWTQTDDIGLLFGILDSTEIFEVSDSVDAGARLGGNLRFGSWLLHSHIEYLRGEISGEQPDNSASTLDLDLDLITVALGVGYRF